MYELIDFYADWCGPCKIMSPIFEELAEEYKGKVELKKVDVEASGEQAAKYGIVSIPTFVLLKDGKEVDKLIGARPKDAVRSWLDSKVK
jgi:thioredoxin 1